ncbi:MAG: hypothetical protein NTX93_01675 [Bacteroidia bacterium]|nr:hypothetical protein [Bacteroidia bacterium]
MYIRIIITKTIWITFLAFMISCRSLVMPITSEDTDPTRLDAIYAQFTFDYGVKGIAPVDMTNSELTGGTLTEESDPADANNQCIMLNKTSTVATNQLTMYKDFTAVTQGTVSVEAKVRVTDASNWKQFTLFANTSTDIAGVIIGDGGNMTAINNTGTNYTLISNVLVNQWYTVKLALNLSAKTYDVYVDGKKMTTKPLAWKNQGIAPGQFVRMLFRNCGSTTADIYYVDSIIVTASNIPGLVYNSGTDKSNNTSGMLMGRTCPTLYHISLPIGWTPTKKWPIFMYNMHDGWDGVAPNDGPEIFAQKRGNMPFIIVSVKTKSIVGNTNGYPQDVLNYCSATSDQLFDEIAVIELFQQIKEDYNGEDKFYWDGFSASGHAFWPLVMWRSEFIAAACVSAGNYLGIGGPDPSDLGRGMTSKGVSDAPERINLPVKQYTGANDAVAEIGVTTGKGMWQQFMNAKATCEAHGYTNVSIDILPGVGHTVHFDAELAYFYAHYMSTHPAH